MTVKRKIKYRVWDIFVNQYIRLDDLMEYEAPRRFNDYFDAKDLIFQQYIGTTDSNGVEIYDGDILSSSNLNYQVVWDDYKWDAVCPYYCKHNWPRFGSYMQSQSRCSTVVGNIFETPDLLKRK